MKTHVLADESMRRIWCEFRTDEEFERWNSGFIKLYEAKGVLIHPLEVKVGDKIDFFSTGWNAAAVKAISIMPEKSDKPYHRIGCVTFETDNGFISVRFNGNSVLAPSIYVFQ
jgi:hypothetical protein